jgi:hypothetical protein
MLLWATGLWTMLVMPDILVPQLPHPLVTLAQLTLQLHRKVRQRDEVVQDLMQMNQHIVVILHVRVSYMFNLSNSI